MSVMVHKDDTQDRTQTWWNPHTAVHYYNSDDEMESAALVRHYDGLRQ